MSSNLERRVARLEQAAGASDAEDAALCERVAQLSPVEREQRFLAIRLEAKDPAVRAAGDAALAKMGCRPSWAGR